MNASLLIGTVPTDLAKGDLDSDGTLGLGDGCAVILILVTP